METLQVRQAIWISAPRHAVWKALTEPAQLLAWYAPGCRWEIPELKPGAAVRFFNTETDVQHATIEQLVEGQELALLWQVDPAMPQLRLLNRFLLSDERGGTRVVITQEGYEALPAEQRATGMAQDDGAYAAVAAGLKAHVEGQRRGD